MNNETEELSQNERRAFSELRHEKTPPAFLEERIVENLKHTGVIRESRLSRLPITTVAVALPISLALFVVGVLAGARWFSEQPKSELPGFILVVRNARPEFEAKSPDEELQRVREYGGWARDLKRKGLMLGGEKLKDETWLLSPGKDSAAISEARVEVTEGAMAGYFLLPVSNYDQALAIAKTCPHLKHGGTVELRQIERFGSGPN